MGEVVVMTYLFAYLLILAPLIWALFFWTLLRIMKTNRIEDDDE